MSAQPLGGNVEIYRDEKGEHRWRRRAENGQVIATSGEGYVRHIDALEIVERQYPDIPILEIDSELKEPEDAA